MTTRRHFMNVSTRLALAVATAGSAAGALAQTAPVTLLKKEFGDKIELVVPSISILAEPAVTQILAS